MEMTQYLEIFIDESNENLQNLNEKLLQLEKNPGDMEILNEVFRVAHTLKGMAGTLGFKNMQNLTHDMENVLSEIRNGNIEPDAKLLDVLFRCLDALESYVEEIVNTGDEGNEEYKDIVASLNAILNGKKLESTDEVKKDVSEEQKLEKIEFSNTEILALKDVKENGLNIYEVKVKLDDRCVLKAARAFLVFKEIEEIGQIIKSKPKADLIEDEEFEQSFIVILSTEEEKEEIVDRINSVSEIGEVLIEDLKIEENTADDQKSSELKKNKTSNKKIDKKTNKEETKKTTKTKKHKRKARKTIRVDIERLDRLMNLVSELIIIKTRLEGIDNRDSQNYDEAVEYLQRITTNLHDSVMKVRMVPVERVFNRFPRLIRDLSRKLNKEFELIMSGEETELDRTVIDEIGDPLIHLLKNSADHGIEHPDERAESGKDKVGKINLRAYQDGNNVIIEVEDDGAGIDVEKVKAMALEKGAITEEEANKMSDQQVKEILFKPSFSMADEITEVSGRGVGLDAVKNKIQGLGGIIEVSSTQGVGTKFTISLPLTLAIIQALMVRLGDEKYAIPLNTIETIEDINIKDIEHVQNQEVIVIRDKVIPVIHLDETFDITRSEERSKQVTVVIVKKGKKEAALVVDSLIAQQEIVIKSLGKYMHGIRMIAGATILGDGEVALIVDINSIVN